MNPTLALVLLALVAASSAKPAVGVEPYKYYPCEVEEAEDGLLEVECPFYNVPQLVREAFLRNAPNTGISSLHMHSDFETPVIDYISDNDLLAGSYDTIKEFHYAYSNNGFPNLLKKLTAIEHIHMDHVNVEHVNAGDLSLPNPGSLQLLSISYAPLYTFEAGAFPEGFKAEVHLSKDNITALNGDAFKPILQNGAKLSFDSMHIKCDCDLSWLCRDGRDLLDRVEGSCVKENGDYVAVQDTDAKDFSNCP